MMEEWRRKRTRKRASLIKSDPPPLKTTRTPHYDLHSRRRCQSFTGQSGSAVSAVQRTGVRRRRIQFRKLSMHSVSSVARVTTLGGRIFRKPQLIPHTAANCTRIARPPHCVTQPKSHSESNRPSITFVSIQCRGGFHFCRHKPVSDRQGLN